MTKRSFNLLMSCVVAIMALGMVFPAAAQETTITFLTPPWGVPPSEEALAAFEAEAGFNVEIQSVQSADLFSRVSVASASGQPAADVIFLTEEAPSNIVATGNMMSLNDLIAATPDLDLSDFNKLDFWTVDEQVYGIPTYVQLVMLDYNTERLAEAGFDAPPTTWQEFHDMAAALKEQGIDEYPIAFPATDWAWYILSLSMGDPMFDEDLNPVFADEGSKAREAMSMLLSFYSEELVSPDIIASGTTPHDAFWSGTGTLHQAFQGSVAVGNNPDVSQQAPNVAYMLMPEEGFTWSFPAAMGIGAGSEHVEEAWQFIQWYVSPENQEAIYNTYGLFPSRTSVTDTLTEAGSIVGADVIAAQSDLTNELPRYALWWGPFATAATETLREAIQNDTPSDEVIDSLAEQWNELKAEYE
ncbi:MAG: extracellular solute-binding protein [Burkholderiales bacterium]|nr:extracellular solute-binding protein [Anaerolineae bacterium]